MKPQALQDAIKAAAAKKAKKPWREPPVKQHIMTKEEYETFKSRRPSMPAPVSPLGRGGGGVGGNGLTADVLRQIESDRREFQREKQSLLNEMRSSRSEINDLRAEMRELRKQVEDLKSQVSSLQNESRVVRGSGTMLAPPSPTKASPSSPHNPWPHLKPHTSEKVTKYQGRDEALKAYIADPKTNESKFFPKSDMSIKQVNGNRIVFFKNKVYIPEKLRDKTMTWYKENYGDAWRGKLKAQCIWPNQATDAAVFSS